MMFGAADQQDDAKFEAVLAEYLRRIERFPEPGR
jgi:hypothetical protein